MHGSKDTLDSNLECPSHAYAPAAALLPHSKSASVREVANALTPPVTGLNLTLPKRNQLGRQAHIEFAKQHDSGQPEMDIRGVYRSTDGQQLILHGRIDLYEKIGDRERVTEFKTVILPPRGLKQFIDTPPERYILQSQIYAYLLHSKLNLQGKPNVAGDSTKYEKLPHCHSRESGNQETSDVTSSSELDSHFRGNDVVIFQENIHCRLVIRNLTDGEQRTWEVPWSVAEVESKLDEYLNRCMYESAFDRTVRTHRHGVARTLNWLYPDFRPGQEDAIALINESINKGKDLLWEAPPGFGKTAVVLYSALKQAMASGRQLFFATAKGGGRDPVRDAVITIQKQSPDLHVLFLSARNELCLKDPATQNSLVYTCKECKLNRIEIDAFARAGLPSELIENNLITINQLREIGSKYCVCPVDLAFALTYRVDLVVGDYNFVFDPAAQLQQFRLQDSHSGPAAWTLLIDEAHNLFNRGRETFSTRIELNEVLNCIRLLEFEQWRFSENASYHALKEILERLSCVIQNALSGIAEEGIVPLDAAQFEWGNLEEGIGKRFAEFLLDAIDRLEPEVESALWMIYRKVVYLVDLQRNDRDSFPFYGDRDLSAVGWKCLDPSEKLREVYPVFSSVVAFSGTMSPIDFYRNALGLGDRPVMTFDTPSIFPKNRQRIVLARGIDTRLRKRSKEAERIANVLIEFCQLREGGYLAVFPSFDFIELVKPYFNDINIHVVAQYRGMSAVERRCIRQALDKIGTSTLALVVAGGQFSEAADYPGDACVGVAIVGPCLPPPGQWREVLRQYWEWRGEDGEQIAYIIPAMQRVIQAAGRLLRRKEDRGIVLLMDDRFLESRFLDLLPSSWHEAVNHSGTVWQSSVEKL